MRNKLRKILLSFLLLSLSFTGCAQQDATNETPAYEASEAGDVQEDTGIEENTEEPESEQEQDLEQDQETSVSLSDIPEYSGDPYVILDENVPGFSEDERTEESFETYSDPDPLGRCGTAYANIGTDLMPTEDREDISSVYPTGWEQAEYDSVDGGYLYNRCHLIGYQLTAENLNEKNLITGTRYLNTEGMLPFENMVADYIKETGNHVLYRVTPVFEGDNLLASGVVIEAESVEDQGEGIEFHVYCYNVQPGIEIDYATGESREVSAVEEEEVAAGEEEVEEVSQESGNYVLNTNTKKFHYPSCSSADRISDANREDYTGSRQGLIDQGYEPCGNCDP